MTESLSKTSRTIGSAPVAGSPNPSSTRHNSSIKDKSMIMKKYVCNICGYVYDPATGDPDSGIAPGTAFEDIPADWVCPVCGVGKEDFSPEE